MARPHRELAESPGSCARLDKLKHVLQSGVTLGAMKRRQPPRILRRSVALPSDLPGELNLVAPQYISRRRQHEFEQAMVALAQDPQIQAECAAIERDFAVTLVDGLECD